MSFSEELADFINPDTPGYVLATVDGASVPALFDKLYAVGMDIAGNAPLLTAISSAVSSAALGTAVVVGGVSYTVGGIEPDGLGLTVLRLQAV